jgi:hypothetical protein
MCIHRAGKGKCGLTGRDSEGFLFSFEDQSFRQTFLSFKSWRQLVAMRLGQGESGPRTGPQPSAIDTATGLRLTVHSMGKGRCALSGRETEGFLCSFDDESLTNTFLSFKSLRQLVSMRLGQGETRVKPVPVAQAHTNATQPAPK